MDANENSGLITSFTYPSHPPPQQQPSSTLSPPSAADNSAADNTAVNTASYNSNGANSDGNAAAGAPLYPQPLSFVPSTGSVEPQRRKRGRPRKYATPEEAAAARRYAAPASVRRKEQHQSFLSGGGSSSLSSRKAYLGGQGFTPYVISVAAGEDVSQKIMLFMQQNKRELCILSASGTIATASLRQPATSGRNITYQGDFEIISLAGSYVRTDQGGKAGGFCACLSSSEGEIVGGGVGGPLIAKGSVEVIVATFSIDPKKDVNVGFKGDASASTLPSPAASTAVYRPVVESSGGFPTRGSDDDDHHIWREVLS